MIPRRNYYRFPSYVVEFLRSVRGALVIFFKVFIFPRKATSNISLVKEIPYGLHILKADSIGKIQCDACRICEQQCPSKCISIKGNQPQLEQFEIEILKCIFCGICQEVCPIDAIVLSQVEAVPGYEEQPWVFDQNILAYREDINPN